MSNNKVSIYCFLPQNIVTCKGITFNAFTRFFVVIFTNNCRYNDSTKCIYFFEFYFEKR